MPKYAIPDIIELPDGGYKTPLDDGGNRFWPPPGNFP